MRVMLHGAINMSNYGDYLFAELFSYALKSNGIEVEFYTHPQYGISDYFAKFLNYTPDRKHIKRVMDSCDALVFISGGYFIEPLKKRFLGEHRHVQRYLKPALYFQKANKPIYILGVGAGPFTNAAFSRKAKKIIDYAKVVTVRNSESRDFCHSFGIMREIEVTADTALLVKEYVEQEKSDVNSFGDSKGKKILLFHIDSNSEVTQKMKSTIIPATIDFLSQHDEYQLYLIADYKAKQELYDEYRKMFDGFDPIVLKYDDPWILTKQIESSSIIITTKLHVGIVGSVFGSSVLSFPFVSNKTTRFYKQIGEADRCVPLINADRKMVYSMLEKYKDKKIAIPKELIERARINLTSLPKQ